MDDASPRAKGARRCTNAECEYGGRWIVGRMATLKNGKLLCRGRGCHSIYEPRQVIDEASEDYRVFVRGALGEPADL